MPMQEKYSHLSILSGALLLESGILQLIYQKAENNNTTKLIRSLFHKNQSQFAPTVSRNNPANYLEPQDIAKLIAWIDTQEYKNNDLEDLLNILATRARKAYPKEYSGKPFKRHFKSLINLIKLSLLENDKYPEYTTQAILLAFMYHKINFKNDYLRYLHALSGLNFAIVRDSFESESFLANKFSHSNLVNFEKYLQRCNLSKLNNPLLFEYIAISLIALKNYFSNFPPQIPQGYYSYGGVNNIAVPNCVETVIQEFCNIILYNAKTKTFDLDKLPKKVQPSEDLKRFYTEFQPTPVATKNWEIGQIWMNIVSNKRRIEYVKGNYEMRPTLDNFLNIINYLFNTQSRTIQEFCENISTENFKIHCDLSQRETQDGVADMLTFNCEDSNMGRFTIIIGMVPAERVWHAWITIPEREANRSIVLNSPYIKKNLFDNISRMPNNILKISLLHLIK